MNRPRRNCGQLAILRSGKEQECNINAVDTELFLKVKKSQRRIMAIQGDSMRRKTKKEPLSWTPDC